MKRQHFLAVFQYHGMEVSPFQNYELVYDIYVHACV